MARLALKLKATRDPKFKVRSYHRCPLCGRVRGYLNRFEMCRICFRFLSLRGEVPGVRKSSW